MLDFFVVPTNNMTIRHKSSLSRTATAPFTTTPVNVGEQSAGDGLKIQYMVAYTI